MKVTVIDRLISPQRLYELSGQSVQAYQVMEKKVCPQTAARPSYSHGTVCAAILAENLTGPIELETISVEYGEDRDTIHNLCCALSWICEQPSQYLCMSIGCLDWAEMDDNLAELTRMLTEKGTSIFAACANNGNISFPAAYPWVTGVRYEPRAEGIQEEINSSVGCNIVVGDFTTPVLEKLAGIHPFFRQRTNSMAAPYVLGRMILDNAPLSTLPKWSNQELVKPVGDISRPVVTLRGPLKQMKELLALFLKSGFPAALFTDRSPTDWVDMVFHATATDLMRWETPLERAGLLLLDIEGDLAAINQQSDCFFDLDQMGPQTAYNRIIHSFRIVMG